MKEEINLEKLTQMVVRGFDVLELKLDSSGDPLRAEME